MRDRKTSNNGLTLRTVAGTYVVFMGFNIDPDRRKDLLGFAIHRTDHTDDESGWLKGGLKFPSVQTDAGEEVRTNEFPIQKFRWGDYTAKPNHEYTYRLEAMYGKPGELKPEDKVEVKVRTEDPLNVGKTHQIHFNRSAAASQAYISRFGDKNPDDVLDGSAFRWLSRGLEENLVKFIAQATDSSYSLHLCIYEFEKANFLESLREAAKRKVKVQILFDWKGKTTKKENPKAAKEHGLTKYCRKRTAVNISHNKFIVLCKNGTPEAVWTGSTNFTDGAVYGQANVGHATTERGIAKQFYDLHQELWAEPEPTKKKSKEIAERLSPVPPTGQPSIYPIFSPRTSIIAIDQIADMVDHANDLVCFTAPFALHDKIEDALDDPQDKFLKFGLLNTRGNVVEKVHRTKGNRMAASARLKTKLDEFQKESLHHRGVYIHTKYFLIDPLSLNPKVITGSANFSDNSCKNNDENQLVIFSQPEVADVYFGEFMRMFDHYAFRDREGKKEGKKKESKKKKPFGLSEDDTWADKYFAGGVEERDRKVFSR
ncbi:MAG TPA: phospholipase D-like domain-containing protein [Bacteroidota bacterium]|nr:phospholipase D-like domain-containing protein [Bacteroidota bacterium]